MVIVRTSRCRGLDFTFDALAYVQFAGTNGTSSGMAFHTLAQRIRVLFVTKGIFVLRIYALYGRNPRVWIPLALTVLVGFVTLNASLVNMHSRMKTINSASTVVSGSSIRSCIILCDAGTCARYGLVPSRWIDT